MLHLIVPADLAQRPPDRQPHLWRRGLDPPKCVVAAGAADAVTVPLVRVRRVVGTDLDGLRVGWYRVRVEVLEPSNVVTCGFSGPQARLFGAEFGYHVAVGVERDVLLILLEGGGGRGE